LTLSVPFSTARATDRLQVVAAALLFSTGGAAVKATALTGWQVASFRSGIDAVVILLMLPSARRAWSRRTVMVGVAYASTMVCYVLANKLTTAANTTFLQSTAPLYILLLGPLFLREPVERRDGFLIAALAVGTAMFFVGPQLPVATAPDPLTGNLVGAACGLSWGLTIVGLRWLGRESRGSGNPSASAVACGNLMACLTTLPFALPAHETTANDWLAVMYLGVFQIAVAYVFLTRGVRRVGALEASLILLLEPVFNPVWAWLVHGERPSGWALVGGSIIVTATALYAWAGSLESPDDRQDSGTRG
jgi:drug/metabolite transporter (DMT)-like permease